MSVPGSSTFTSSVATGEADIYFGYCSSLDYCMYIDIMYMHVGGSHTDGGRL